MGKGSGRGRMKQIGIERNLCWLMLFHVESLELKNDFCLLLGSPKCWGTLSSRIH